MFRPLNKRLVGRLVLESEETKIGGLYVAKKEPKRDTYTVISVAENEQGIKPGDCILIEKYDALEKQIDGETLYIIQCDRVLGVLDAPS